MNVATMGLILLVIAVVLLALKMPIGFLLLIASFVGLIMAGSLPAALSVMGSRPFDINRSYDMSVVPLFVLMGHLAYAAGITERLFSAARKWVGHLGGGLVHATVLANAAFGACCGSTTAAVAVFGRVAIPEMLEAKVDHGLAAGSVAAGANLSALIPPSVLAVFFGVITLTSIPKLLVAGILPGVLTVVLYAVMIAVRVKINPSLAPAIATGMTWKGRFRELKGVWGVVVLFGLVMGGIWGGIFTPTEGGAIGCIGSFIIVLAFRKFTRTVMKESFLETARTTAVIFIVVTGAMILTMFLALTGLTAAMSGFIIGLPVSPVVLVIGYALLILFLGCILDPMSCMVVTLPIIMQPFIQLGIDPIWLGVLTVKLTAVGMITPPLGLNCFMLKSIRPDFSLGEIFRGCGWFMVMEGIAIALLITFPQISTFLPATMYR